MLGRDKDEGQQPSQSVALTSKPSLPIHTMSEQPPDSQKRSHPCSLASRPHAEPEHRQPDGSFSSPTTKPTFQKNATLRHDSKAGQSQTDQRSFSQPALPPFANRDRPILDNTSTARSASHEASRKMAQDYQSSPAKSRPVISPQPTSPRLSLSPSAELALISEHGAELRHAPKRDSSQTSLGASTVSNLKPRTVLRSQSLTHNTEAVPDFKPDGSELLSHVHSRVCLLDEQESSAPLKSFSTSLLSTTQW